MTMTITCLPNIRKLSHYLNEDELPYCLRQLLCELKYQPCRKTGIPVAQLMTIVHDFETQQGLPALLSTLSPPQLIRLLDNAQCLYLHEYNQFDLTILLNHEEVTL